VQPCWYHVMEAGLMHPSKRDDRGDYNNTLVVNGVRLIRRSYPREIVALRASARRNTSSM